MFSTKATSRDEALDLLGDLIPATSTGLFGDKPVKLVKPRPKWHVLGLTIIHRECTCLTCKTTHKLVNPLIMLTESLIDHEGRVLKSVKTHSPESIREKDVDYSKLEILEESITIDPISFCQNCISTDLSAERIVDAFKNQCKLDAQRVNNDNIIKSASALKATRERAEEAEKKLFALIDKLDIPDVDVPFDTDDLPY
jgi:hypothetical protein